MHFNPKIIVALWVSLVFFGCSPQTEKQPFPDVGGEQLKPLNERALTITDFTGAPVAGAKILIGKIYSQENLIFSNSSGQFLPPVTWKDRQTLTIEASGFILTSYLHLAPEGQVLKIRQAPRRPTLTLKGSPAQFPVVNLDDKVDFGILFSKLQRRDLFLFDISKLLSPELDTLNLPLGQKLNVPSNLSLPKQTEKYGILRLTLDKPQFRLFFEDFGDVPVISLRGSFPFNKTIKDAQNSDEIYKIVNNFTFSSGGFKNVPFRTDFQNFNYEFNDFKIDQSFQMRTPDFSQDLAAFAVSGFFQDGILVPTDIKSFEKPGALTTLALSQKSSRFLITALKRKDEMSTIGQVSVSVDPIEGDESVVTPVLLPLISAPNVQNKYNVSFFPPALSGLQPVGSYFYLSEILPERSVDLLPAGLNAQPIWDVISSQFETEISLPQWPFSRSQETKQLKWSSSFLANQTPTTVLNLDDLNQVTHSTYNEIVFESK